MVGENSVPFFHVKEDVIKKCLSATQKKAFWFTFGLVQKLTLLPYCPLLGFPAFRAMRNSSYGL